MSILRDSLNNHYPSTIHATVANVNALAVFIFFLQ